MRPYNIFGWAALAQESVQPQQQNETSVLAPLPAPRESLDDSPNPPKSQAQVRVVTVEVG